MRETREQLGLSEEDSNTAQEDPVLEKARKLALVVEYFNSAAHSFEACRGKEQIKFRMAKDFFMRRLAEHCLTPEGIEAGLKIWKRKDDRFKETLDVDIPFIGHLNWHFGSKGNALGFRRDMATFLIDRGYVNIEENRRNHFIEVAKNSEKFLYYNFPVEPRRNSDEFGYGNVALLIGEDYNNFNKMDRNIIMEGVPYPSKQLDKDGNIIKRPVEEIYGIEGIIRPQKPVNPTEYSL